MLDLELHAEFHDYSVVEIGTIVCDNSFGDTIPTNKVMLNEPSDHILSNRGKRGCSNLLCKIINSDQDETVPIGSNRLNLSNHINSPYCKQPRSSQYIRKNQRHIYFVSINLAFVTSP